MKKTMMLADVVAVDNLDCRLGLTPQALTTQLNAFGFIFEQMCVRDLKD
ncbi:MAG: hypothetical protein J1F13_03080 [Prevotellaceae bacterium]|nr:hypothetical protein [Prevotellaceae bacterium]